MGKVYDLSELEEMATPAPKLYDPGELEEVAPEKTGQGEAAFLHGAQGASFGTSDELAGVANAMFDNPLARKIREKLGIMAPAEVPVATTREGKPIAPPVNLAPQSFGEAYVAGRDTAREQLEQTRKDWGKTALASEIGGALLTPLKAPGLKGIKAAETARPIVKAAADVGRVAIRSGIEAAAYGAGASQADLTKGEVGKLLLDTGKAGIVGAGIGGAAATGGKLVRGGAESIVENLEQRVLNELAEGGHRSVGQKVRAKLAKAGRAILGEVIEGPDGETVRRAMQQSKAETGQKILAPVLERVGAKLDEGYEAFRAAGKAINPAQASAYYNRLIKRAQDPSMSAAESKAIEQLADNWRDIVGRHKGEPVDLQRLRKFTTETQEAAAAISSDPSVREKLKLKLSAIASDAMDDMLTRAAGENAKLQAAANLIRENNQRWFGLKSVDTALASRVAGEASSRSMLVRAAEKVATPASFLGLASGAGLVLQDPDKMVERAGLGLGLALGGKLLPAGARAVERAITTRAINMVRAAPAPAGGTVRERLAAKLRAASANARRFESYGRVGGGLVGRAALKDERERR